MYSLINPKHVANVSGSEYSLSGVELNVSLFFSINCLVFVKETQRVHCTVRTETVTAVQVD
jgi:hypothetical protein